MEKDKILLLAALGGAIAGGAAAILLLKEQQEEEPIPKRPRSTWVSPWLQKRDEDGAFAKLLPELYSGDRNEQKLFADFVRMWKEDFDHVLELVQPTIEKQNTTMRNAIRPGARLALTLHFLATGHSFRSLQYMFRIPQCTITTIVPEVLDAIYDALAPTYLKVNTFFYRIMAYDYLSFTRVFGIRRFRQVLRNGRQLKKKLMNCGTFRIVLAPSMENTSL